MNIQKIIDHLYRFPLYKWKMIQRFGGFWDYHKMLQGQKQMMGASRQLPTIVSDKQGLHIYFLTGKNYFYQTLYCAFSLNKVSKEKFQFILVDDGSFDEDLIKQISKQMPGAEIITADTIALNLKKHLPKSQFPYLHVKREIYPHIRKLTDIHTLDNNPYKLVLDSDMIFWDEPHEVISWLKTPNGCLYMLDCEESYGYDRNIMRSLCGHDIPPLVNVGLLGISSNTINFQNLEVWSKTLEDKQGASYFLEQALSAMLVADMPQTILKKEEYVVNPNISIIGLDVVKLHHYVDLSKKHYFNTFWKKI